MLGWHLSRTGKANTASAALDQTSISRDGMLGRRPESFLLRSDIGPVVTGLAYTRLVRSYGLKKRLHHSALPTAERNGGARDLDIVGAGRASASL